MPLFGLEVLPSGHTWRIIAARLCGLKKAPVHTLMLQRTRSNVGRMDE
jgi:hypothetical protein